MTTMKVASPESEIVKLSESLDSGDLHYEYLNKYISHVHEE